MVHGILSPLYSFCRKEWLFVIKALSVRHLGYSLDIVQPLWKGLESAMIVLGSGKA